MTSFISAKEKKKNVFLELLFVTLIIGADIVFDRMHKQRRNNCREDLLSCFLLSYYYLLIIGASIHKICVNYVRDFTRKKLLNCCYY